MGGGGPIKDPYENYSETGRERVRFLITKTALNAKRATGIIVTDDEIIRQHGYKNITEFRLAEFSMSMTVPEYIKFLTSYHVDPSLDKMHMMKTNISIILKKARSEGLQWIFRDTQASASPAKSLDGWMVYPRPATEWLLSLPTERGLVSRELREFLSPEMVAPESHSNSDKKVEKLPTNQGRRPEKRAGIEAKMRKMDIEYLKAMKEEAMATEFNASRDTCRKARNIVLSKKN